MTDQATTTVTDDEAGDLQTRHHMLKSWLTEADAVNDILKKHLNRVLDIAYTWQPGYATKMDLETLKLAGRSIGYMLPSRSSFDEAKCLEVNPFEGDFGSPGDRVLKDKIGTARKSGACGMCRQEIIPGERVRLLAAVFDGALMNYRWCSACCWAMAASWTDDGEAWEARARLGRESSNTTNTQPHHHKEQP